MSAAAGTMEREGFFAKTWDVLRLLLALFIPVHGLEPEPLQPWE
jgi:hypothetical protein